MEVSMNRFKWPDYVVFVSILVISVLIGIFHGCLGNRNKSSTDYLLGGRRMNWLPVALSIIVTFTSAILYVGIPAEVYIYGVSIVLIGVGMFIAMIITVILFVPLLYPLKLTSTYEVMFIFIVRFLYQICFIR